ncbi:COP9 signalosome (CSN) subunit [Exophiala dermatitidis]|uniref:Protein CSN12 homolog n=2 Tax=Exophiala dermatitidis TaxID=5970 RepID=H6C1Y7_EXODN|nr:phospholipase A2 [Exophiala dermatitidis NIH/UT8656]KAJ4508458.1 COP9 signalosome (CSN) subunit [Exophiala dermatitidis]EHY58674.1 phospholipase A2 [Exophiala dermatitidis NIH/UT8656]KAJ4510369.1 COP9 signalosome (CSN) subunit [Exophiala dermatitidis]KAJ4510696.1 COP9 signalosome (CSN) subunit [Exophiala dermatitidis]KAJ4534977.1 COP9 signalosome (CSN) subunit [Exophiala dermatitidis]
MGSIFADFHQAQRNGDGRLLASCLAPLDTPQDPRRLQSFAQLSNYQEISAAVRYYLVQDPNSVGLPKAEANAWVDIFVALWKTVKELVGLRAGNGTGDWVRAFDSYKELCNQLVRGYTNYGFQSWTVPCLYIAGKYIRMIAMKADSEGKPKDTNGGAFANGFSDDIMSETNKHEKLEQAAWTINRMFTVCLSDRAELVESRKWGIYSTTNLLFKTYFKLNSISLTRNVIRALEAASADLPPLELFPKSHRCTFKYYRGVIDFLQENYTEAEQHLTEALTLCHKDSLKNREQILTYLIPAHVINHHQLPRRTLLSPHPTLSGILTPLFDAIRKGSLAGFEEALTSAEPELVKRRIYLTLERTRDLCLRNLFRKVFLAAGWEDTKDPTTGEVTGKIRRTRIRVEEFEAGMRVGYKGATDVIIERDEVECFLANIIYKNLMKGYIARDRGIVVLSKAGAFPGTGV